MRTEAMACNGVDGTHKDRLSGVSRGIFGALHKWKDIYLLNSQPPLRMCFSKHHTPSEHMRSTSLFHESKRL